MKKVMIIAGEASGDVHGAKLVKNMKEKNNNIYFCGIGGACLKKEGVELFFDAKELAVVGIFEVLSKITVILKALNETKKKLKSIKPDLLILIDFPDFNFKIAKFAKKLNITILYYISPQIWAWRQSRVHFIKKKHRSFGYYTSF